MTKFKKVAFAIAAIRYDPSHKDHRIFIVCGITYDFVNPPKNRRFQHENEEKNHFQNVLKRERK